ncbi:efflux RND transporter permease subunit [Haliovirga abyssi]|uniref:Transporter n=1 Tax=Haliovirga abyssi TaxID=2996794 RepID=A0AAU9DNG6_9FUSO|nr:MMPL family transporter [Haliovirga abyssi]BDU51612.1 transporter [Haliovirga abyssi]
MFNKIFKFIEKRSKLVIFIFILATVISLYLTSKLEVRMQMMDLLPKNEKLVQIYNKALKNFTSTDNIAVGVEGNEKDIENYIRDIAPNLKKIKNIKKVEYELNSDFLKSNSLLLVKQNDLENMQDMLTASNLQDFIAGINNNFEESYINSGDSQKMSKDKTQMLSFLNTIQDFAAAMKNGDVKTNFAKQFLIGKKYTISPDRKMGIFLIKSAVNSTDIMGMVNLVNSAEKYLKDNAKKYNVKVSLTGTQVISRDEMVVSNRDMTISTTVSIILMIIIFLAAFRYIRYSLLVIVPLSIGIILAMGFTYIVFGHLNIMTAMMGAILIGLGIDYSIHIISIFLEEKDDGKSTKEAVKAIFKKGMKGIIAGSITTAFGFYVFSISSFPGFREFGVVLGSGIVFTLITAVFLLPTLLLKMGDKKVKLIKTDLRVFDRLEKIVIHRPKRVLAVVLVILVILGMNIPKVSFEKNMMNIEAKGLESIALNKKIIDKFGFTSDNSIAISKNLKEARIIKEKADNMSTVGQIDSIAFYIPDKKLQLKRMKKIAEIKKILMGKKIDKLNIVTLKDELYRLNDNLIEISDLAYMGGETKLVNKCDEITKSNILIDFADNLAKYKGNLQKFQNKFIAEWKNIIENMNDKNIITIKNLPEDIRENYIGKNGEIMTTLYPKGDIWNSDFQKGHIAELKTLGKNVSGTALVYLKVIDISGSEGKRILLLSVFVIYFIILIDFRSIKYATMAILPMILTIFSMMGIMGMVGVKFNVVNIIALPLIIGIGVDDGIHIINRYRIENNLYIALKSTGKAILLTTITTAAAFGTLMLAKYRGFITFGLLLTLGVVLAYFFTIFFLVSVLAIFDQKTIKGGEQK